MLNLQELFEVSESAQDTTSSEYDASDGFDWLEEDDIPQRQGTNDHDDVEKDDEYLGYDFDVISKDEQHYKYDSEVRIKAYSRTVITNSQDIISIKYIIIIIIIIIVIIVIILIIISV